VWTEAKVSFLLYDLKTRLGIDDLATCSTLTASASRAQHLNALGQLEKILGVPCFDSPAEFVDWLRPGAELDLPHHPLGFEPRIGGTDARTALSPTDRAIVAHLFRDSTQVDLEPISGGYSGALVWRVTSQDALGHRQAPAVVKLGPNRAIAQERVAFDQVEAVLGNNAPRVRGFVDLGDQVGLKYAYAAMGHGQVRTLQAMFAADAATRLIISVVRSAFEDVLGPLYAAARYERMPLFEHYQFSPGLGPTVRNSVAAITAQSGQKVLDFPGGMSLPNVCGFYEDFVAHHRLPAHDYHYVAYVHGDLNAANILVDAHHNVWVIDFFHARPGHVLKDLAKFENDLLYVLTPIEDPPSFWRPSPSPAPCARSPISGPNSPTAPTRCVLLTSSGRGRCSGCCAGSGAGCAARTVTPCSSRWPSCVTRSTRSASPRRHRSRNSRRWQRRARSPIRSPAPSKPS
jgi:aminoglycoside phosphotransferase (APT) family kinase protein